jgi:predicted RNA-binding protein with PIN domain
MPYLIDGHNLIGSIADIHLDDPEDELQLMQRLGKFLKDSRKSGTVYFDQRAPGTRRMFKVGRLQVEFATPPNSADLAIQDKLQRLKGEARNYTVISSDREVMQAAMDAGAQVMDSHTFIKLLERPHKMIRGNEKPEAALSPEELEFWQKMFENPPDN